MTIKDFSESSTMPVFTYERDAIHARSYRIMKWDAHSFHKEPVGDYTVLDLSEEAALSEKKVINLISILNDKTRLLEIGEGSQTRKLYRVVSENGEDGKATVIFYTLSTTGVSVENAILRIKAECISLKDASERQCAGASDSGFLRPEIQASHEIAPSHDPGLGL